MPVSMLDRPLYSIWEAAQLLGLPSPTLRRWLEGTTITGVAYPPVIRSRATGSESVSWAEFIEAGFLRGYRRKRVPLQKMRPFIERARKEFGVPYPLAHFKPFVTNKRLVWEMQIESGLEPVLFLVQETADQMVWADSIQDFLERVEFAPDPADYVARLFPLGRDRPVVIDPEVAFGIPQIRGIRTELIAESMKAGGLDEAAGSWGVTPAEIDAALTWESSLSRAA